MEDRLQTRVGVVVLFLFAVGVGLSIALVNRHLLPGFVIHIEFARTGGMRLDAPVRVSGRVVGVIDGVRLLPRRGGEGGPGARGGEQPILVLDVWIERRSAGLIRENSVVFVNQRSLGDAFLEIGPPDGELGPIVHAGSTLRGVDAFSLDRLLRDVDRNLIEVGAVMAELLPDVVAFAKALDELYDQISALEPEPGAFARLVDSAAEISAIWSELTGDSRDAPERLLAAVRDTRALVARARVDLAALAEKAGRVLDAAGNLEVDFGEERRARLERAVAGAERTLRTIDAILANLEAIVTVVEIGGGSIGALLQDAEFQDDIKTIFRMLEEQPWRAVGHP